MVLPNGVLPASTSYQVMCDLPFASGEPSTPGNGSYKLLITPLASGEGLSEQCSTCWKRAAAGLGGTEAG